MSKDNRIIVSLLFGLYNVLALSYDIKQFIIFKDKGNKYKVKSLSIATISLAGLLMYFFSMDIVGSEVTIAGIIHIIIAGIMAPLTIITCFLGFHTFKDHNKMKKYSLITSIIVLVCGGTSAYLATNGFILMGLFERFTIGSYIIWLMVTGIYYKKIEIIYKKLKISGMN